MSEGPDPVSTDSDESPGPRDWWRQFWGSERFGIALARELMISVVLVLLVAGILFGIAGVWPPLVAVESDSMEDQIMTGDLVFVVHEDRFAHDAAVGGTGIVPAEEATVVGYERFDRPGDVIIFMPNGDDQATPIIHRAHYWVEEGENWYDRADPDRVGNADDCDELSHCPAPHAGFITHGDNNAFYDQVQEDSGPVKPDWVISRAHRRVPLLGRIRLLFDDYFSVTVPSILSFV